MEMEQDEYHIPSESHYDDKVSQTVMFTIQLTQNKQPLLHCMRWHLFAKAFGNYILRQHKWSVLKCLLIEIQCLFPKQLTANISAKEPHIMSTPE